MTPWFAALLLPAVLGGHTTEPYWVAIPILGLFLVMRVMRARGRGGPRGRGPGRGPWGSGTGGHSGSTEDPPMQMDIRKPTQEDAPAPSEEQNPPSDL
jgi:hypothetical protein